MILILPSELSHTDFRFAVSMLVENSFLGFEGKRYIHICISFTKGPSLAVCPVENTDCNDKKILVSFLSVAQDVSLK